MVGVPGRSKGCVTCRRRKKGCDLKRPACRQCTSRGLTCGGYDDDRIFINHSTGAEQVALLRPTVGGDSESDTVVSRASMPQLSLPLDFRIIDPSDIDIILPSNLSRSAYSVRILERFFALYAPEQHATAISRADPSNTFFFTSILSTLYTRDEALRLALLSLGMAMQGTINADEEMMRQGRLLYGKGLKEMQQAISDKSRVNNEAILASPRIYAMFEMLFGADDTPTCQSRNWKRHAHGELALMRARGPAFLADGYAHQIFVDGRLVPIFAAIHSRRATLMNEPVWKTMPWGKNSKSPKDLLFDILAEMGGFLENIDAMHASNEPFRSEKLIVCTHQCKQLNTELTSWATTYNHLLFEPDSPAIIPYDFPDPMKALLSVLYWTTSLILYDAFPSAFNLTSSLQSKNPRFYARRVALSVPYYFAETRGMWGVIMISFPMACAVLHLAKNGGPECGKYVGVVMKAWKDPKLPACIKKFLDSIWADASDGWQAKIGGELGKIKDWGG
ncbi:hypothetical protein K458DRAFT_42760 [Lentithecium fluviatile CBS 122367]|uniref:Zn(2)-C6 fungal-type domain-containing protein n=1 Tax=Lentithecium fluviatile CBS 122367 TaxID=1168545 RepID=A0A6G1J0A7_9PLEO|nr:hypothetical protein K458DRAFT_42760 [Lentithecium fluviatile CBS 122367]